VFRYVRLSLLFLVLLPLACGPKVLTPTFPLVPVSGQVLMDNQPLANAMVRFQPIPRVDDTEPLPDSLGVTDEQGHYKLKVVGQRFGKAEGAIPREHFVRISIFNREENREMVPTKYNRESKLQFIVPAEGTKEADFKLTTR
jgi:hypothetical protein